MRDLLGSTRLTKPQDRDVVCHASAWDVDQDQDLRIKMCIEITGEDFVVVHHELGHNFYQRAYREKPFLYRDSANDGFHEAIGDAVALSVTPDYLVKVGLPTQAPVPEGPRYLIAPALAMSRFLFASSSISAGSLLGRVTPDTYNAPGGPPRQYSNEASPAAAADPSTGRQMPTSRQHAVPRYFRAILQFQFQRAMCREAGYTGPLHRCSVYDNKKVGARLAKMLEMGRSRPWPDALEALTGERQMDATAIIDYFKPLKEWLDAQAAAEKPAAGAAPTP